jgi:hypothetical protein
MLYVLNRFLSVQDQSQHGTEQVLNLRARMRIDDTEFEILRSEMCKLAWEGFCESRSEHYNELVMTKPKKSVQPDSRVSSAFTTRLRASKAPRTYGDVRIVCQNFFMRRRRWSLGSRRRDRRGWCNQFRGLFRAYKYGRKLLDLFLWR